MVCDIGSNENIFKLYEVLVGGRVEVGPEGDDVKAGFSKMNGSLYWIGMHILYKGCRTLQEGQ